LKISASDAVALRGKFAEVASGLSRKPRQQGDEAQRAREASMARACAAVVDDVVPIVVSAGRFECLSSIAYYSLKSM
jgi:hypothetical protein